MSERLLNTLPLADIELPPTEDDLPYDDGMPMETNRHRQQMTLLLETIENAWSGRDDFFVGGNMFVYFSPEQVKDYDFKGPDFFAVVGVPRRDRKSWVTWQEGKAPDVIIELLSTSTARFDKTEKKRIYQNRLRTPEYFWYDPFSAEWAGFRLHGNVYQPIKPDRQGRLVSQSLDLALVRWDGVYSDVEARWLRWATLEGELLPTGRELADQAWLLAEEERLRADAAQELADVAQQHAASAQQQAEAAQQQAKAAQQQAHSEHQRAEALARMLARYEAQFGQLSEE